MLDVPRSGALVAWGNALLSGRVGPDDAVTRITHGDEPHRVVGLPGESGPVGLSLALGRLRALGATGLRLALPAPGDPLGLPGPPEFNDAALQAGEAAVTVGLPGGQLGLVPEGEVYGPPGDQAVRVLWRVYEAADRPFPGPFLAEADRELAAALKEATDVLMRLDVGGTGARTGAVAAALRARPGGHESPLAPGYPQRAVRVVEQAYRVATILELAGQDHGAAVNAYEMSARTDSLVPLERACRRALVAAFGAALEPSAAD
ncbi:hypothetical protein [Yinghuangia seranimata]|uniref:hypothetical protein n=1 Tax=Yinghuangia seranimata TaxID=408067 RepID=UPI00248CF80D|nr:hypothetical protein [Yinghuangia seranimata]MDI2126390.1 hypothetical protein [Yinghuangia seranimata]